MPKRVSKKGNRGLVGVASGRSWLCTTRFRWFRTMPRSLCSTAVAGSTSRRCVPLLIVGAVPGRYVAARGGVPVPGSSRPPSWPTPPVCHRRRHRPRSTAVVRADPTSAARPVGRRLGPEHWPDAPPPPAATPGYPPQYAVFAPLPSCQRRSPLAPFFTTLYRLTIDDGCAGAGRAPLALSQTGMQRVIGALPGSVPTPGTEVVEDDTPR